MEVAVKECLRSRWAFAKHWKLPDQELVTSSFSKKSLKELQALVSLCHNLKQIENQVADGGPAAGSGERDVNNERNSEAPDAVGHSTGADGDSRGDSSSRRSSRGRGSAGPATEVEDVDDEKMFQEFYKDVLGKYYSESGVDPDLTAFEGRPRTSVQKKSRRGRRRQPESEEEPESEEDDIEVEDVDFVSPGISFDPITGQPFERPVTQRYYTGEDTSVPWCYKHTFEHDAIRRHIHLKHRGDLSQSLACPVAGCRNCVSLQYMSADWEYCQMQSRKQFDQSASRTNADIEELQKLVGEASSLVAAARSALRDSS